MIKLQNLIAEENHQLSSLRDWLLPMLMNGQVVSAPLKLDRQGSTTIYEANEKLSMAAEDGVGYGARK